MSNDLGDQLIETWLINDRINRYLLEAVGHDRLSVTLAKGKSDEGQFSHIHNVRLMWLKAAAPELMEGLEKLEKGGLGVAELSRGLEASGEAITKLIRATIESGGRVKNFKPNVTSFVGYLISHESNHRAHIELALRQAGVPLTDKASYGIWEWGVR